MKKDKKHVIGIIMQSPDLGGAEEFMLLLIKSFVDKDTKIVLASNKEKFFSKAKKLPILAFEIPFILDIIGNYRGLIKSIILSPFMVIWYLYLLIAFKKEGVSVILMSGFSEKLMVSFLSIFFRIPVVWIEYGRLEPVFRRNFYLPKLLYILFQRIPKKIIVPSKNTFNSLLTSAKVAQEKLFLLPLGIELRKSNPSIVLSTLKDRFIIGNVSRLTREKGQNYLIQAMPYILKKIPNAHLFIIGEGPDKKFYLELIKKYSLEKCVTITGFVKNISDYYSMMDIFVFPTVWDLEGFGLVLPEAMSYKIPVIATNIGPVSEIIDDEVTGLLVPPHDDYALAQAIISLHIDKKKKDYFVQNAYKKVKKHYDITHVSKKVLTVLFNSSEQG